MPIVKSVTGSIIDRHKDYSTSLIARICSATSTTTDNISENFPEVVEVDKNFPLPALYRLGNYSVANTEYGSVLNFYLKLYDEDAIELSALASCLKKLSMEAIKMGNYIELSISFPSDFPRLDIIKKILNYQEQLLITLITDDKGQVSMGEE